MVRIGTTQQPRRRDFMNTTPIQHAPSKVIVGALNVPHLQRTPSKVVVGALNVPHLKR
jgi:hypothetical protein